MKKDDFDQEFFKALKTVITRLDDLDSITCSSWAKVLIERIEELDNATEKLKPCPFCGSSPILSENDGNETLPQSWCVLCLDTKCPLDIMTLDYPSKQEAAKAWNTRASEKATLAICGICEDYFIKGALPICSSCIKDITRGNNESN